MIARALFGLALAGEREALPALPVERPLVLPRGVTAIAVGWIRQGRPPSEIGSASLRYGVLPRVELSAGGSLRQGGEREPLLGARLRLHRREPSNTTVAADLRFAEAPGAALLAARRLGPLLGTVGLGARWRSAPILEASGSLLLQIGPLGPWVSAQKSARDPVEGEVGLGVQLSRGLGIRGSLQREQRALGLEIAF